jgi:hypothetical protein
MDKRANYIEQEMREEQNRLIESIKSQYSEDFTMMEGRMKGIIERYKTISKVDNRNFVEAMQATHAKYILLNKQDDEQTEKIKAKTLKIKSLEESLTHWKAKWLNNLREYEERNRQLTNEKEQLAMHYKELKKKMTRFRETEKKRLADLVKMAKDTTDTLNKKLDQSKRILQLAELCRKYENEEERAMPFEPEQNNLTDNVKASMEQLFNEENPESTQVDDEVDDGMTNGLQENRDRNNEVQINQSEWEQLIRFYRKYNKVELDKIALQQEREQLLEENQKLRHMLKAYLDGISVNEDVLSRKNPLLVIDRLETRTKKNTEGKMELVTIQANNSKVAIAQ